jgi:capsular polysaccharide biosynthesis protein
MPAVTPGLRERVVNGVSRRVGLLPRAYPLQVQNEDAALAFVEDAAAGPLRRPGVHSHAVPSVQISEAELNARLLGRADGTAMPSWAEGEGGALRSGVSLMRAMDVHHAPAFGAVIGPRGLLYGATISEALYLTPTLAALPETHMIGGKPLFAPSRRAPRRPRASIFLAWGGRFNYGHFLIDCLSGLTILADRDLLRDHPAIAPPLNGWQRGLLDLLLRPGESVEEIDDELVRIDDALWTSCMDHFLQAPNTPLDRVRARILANTPAGGPGPRRLYLSRRDDNKRRLLNEDELEAEMAARGFTVVSPENLPVAEQVALFRDAAVVVAPTGAALANCMFMAPGAAVFEIQPANFLGAWQRNLCEFFDLRWHGYFCPSPEHDFEHRVEGVLHAGLQFTWRLPTPDFLAFLDARL